MRLCKKCGSEDGREEVRLSEAHNKKYGGSENGRYGKYHEAHV